MGFFQENLDFIKSIKKYVWLSVIVLVAGLIAGLFLPAEIKYQFLNALQDKARAMGEVNGLTIFINNIGVSLIMILSGVLILFPLLIVFFNGLSIGAVLALFGPVMGWPEILGTILIHGVFELGAFVLAGALGMLIALKIFKRSPLMLSWRELMLKVANTVFLFIVPLLMMAALMESTVSQVYLQHVNRDLYQHQPIDTLTTNMAFIGYGESGSSFRDYVAVRTLIPDLQRPLPLIVNFTNNQSSIMQLYINQSNHINDALLQGTFLMTNYHVFSNKGSVYYLRVEADNRQLKKIKRAITKNN